MQCADVHAVIRAGEPLTGALVDHVAQCPSCRALSDRGGALAGALDAIATPDAAGLDGLLSRIDADLARESGLAASLRERPTRIRLVLAIVGAMIVPLVVLFTTPRPDLGVYPALRFAIDVLALFVPAAVAAWIVLRPLHRSVLPRWVEPAAVAIGIVALWLVVVLPAPHHDHPASLLGVGDDFLPRARACFTMGTITGIPILIWVRLLSRRAGPPWGITASIAVLAALVGALSVFLHCPIVSPRHLAAGHASIIVPFVVAWALGLFRSR